MDHLVTNKMERLWHADTVFRDEWVERHARQLPAGSRVLDAGAGASKYRPFFAHCRYETQDFCQYSGPTVAYLEPIDHVCDIAAIPLPDASLDAIVCTEVIEHVVDPPLVLRELARLLKPGGKLLLSSPLISHLHMEPYHFYGGFTPYWYRHWMPLTGFAIESITPVGGPGRTVANLGMSFYLRWSAAEKKAAGGRRLVSWPFRMVARMVFLWLFPWLLPRLDPWLGNEVVCSEYLVVATRPNARQA